MTGPHLTPEREADKRYVYATVTIEVAFSDDDPDTPLTQAEIEDLASDGPGSWAYWTLLNVGGKRGGPLIQRRRRVFGIGGEE